jgi:hypothetical protein
MKTWKYLPNEECPACGDDVQIYTEELRGMMADGNKIRCSRCDATGRASVDADSACVIWNEW